MVNCIPSDMSARTLTAGSQASAPTGGVGASAGAINDGAGLAGPKSKSELTIKLFREKPLSISYDARQIDRALKQEYEIDKDV